MRRATSGRIRLIKAHRLYSTKELAEELGVHPRTIQQWQKDGLEPIDPTAKPFIYRGQIAKKFLIDRQSSKKRPLNDGEFFCMRCRKPVGPLGQVVFWKALENSNRLIIKGRCEDCYAGLNRFMSKIGFLTGVFGQMARRAYIRLYESQPTNVNTDLRRELFSE